MSQSMTQEELEQKCREWQGILRLQDWDVRPLLGRYHEMSEPSNTGNCSFHIYKKTALIRIKEDTDTDPRTYSPLERDQEVDLVHELLHLHFAPFDRDDETPEGTAQEQAIHAISTALVKLKRGT